MAFLPRPLVFLPLLIARQWLAEIISFVKINENQTEANDEIAAVGCVTWLLVFFLLFSVPYSINNLYALSHHARYVQAANRPEKKARRWRTRRAKSF